MYLGFGLCSCMREHPEFATAHIEDGSPMLRRYISVLCRFVVSSQAVGGVPSQLVACNISCAVNPASSDAQKPQRQRILSMLLRPTSRSDQVPAAESSPGRSGSEGRQRSRKAGRARSKHNTRMLRGCEEEYEAGETLGDAATVRDPKL
jgi:hypothetical protein